MTDTESRLLDLLGLFATHSELSVSTVSRLALGSGDVPRRLLAGGTITVRRLDHGLQYLSDNWPEGIPWPSHSPRPDRTPRQARLTTTEDSR